MGESTISVDAPQVVGDRVRWTGWFGFGDGERWSTTFDLSGPDPEGLVPTVRPFLLAFLLPAMRIGAPLRLEEPVDASTLGNLMEWQEAMADWHPGTLHVVPIHAEVAPEPWVDRPPPAGAVTAFSGGLDSTFTAVRLADPKPHESGGLLHRRAPLAAGVMVHGFDIPLTAAPEVFPSALARSRRILDALGVDLYDVHTDLKAAEVRFGINWETAAHGPWLAAALSCFETWCSPLVIPGSFPYRQQILPWASNPVTDPLLGSDCRPVWHDGTAPDRVAKLRRIGERPEIARELRVCWAGVPEDRNCGRCPKCIATQVAFWLVGDPEPAAFPVRCTLDDVRALRLDSQHRFDVWANLLTEAERSGRTDLVDLIAGVIDASHAALGAPADGGHAEDRPAAGRDGGSTPRRRWRRQARGT